ncbi:MAG TPA: hypothetical protein VKY92_02660 [Verrucomicrobiae bacterium]|jgi:hypothetical protein|nr:hypothetical protein [Verrucomicrobiae bacterium]
MSLLRLLTAGKSLVGLKNKEGRYNLSGDGRLPRFGPKPNPFRGTVFPDKGEKPDRALETPPEQSPPVKSVTSESTATQATEDRGRVVNEPACTAPQANCEPVPSRRTGLRALLLWGRAKKPKNGLSGARPLVQGELSLDTVKVVRNDLSESDLEVVQARPAGDEKVRQGRNGGLGATSGPDEKCYAAAGLAVAGKS